MTTRRGLLLILSSPSGAGKSSLARRLVAWDPAIRFSISATTRPPRPGEVDGREYHFRSRADFAAMIAEGAMLEHAEVFGNLYGSPRAPVEAALAEGRDTLFDIDWQGGQQIRQAMRDDTVSVFVLPPSIAALEARLTGRGQDSPAVIASRMAKAQDEISHWAEYDYVLVNRDLDACTADLIAIVTAERLRRTRQPGLSAFVRALNAEVAARTGEMP
ncbi:MAG: guanylate kinase [Gemmobacter sp.]